GGPRVPRRVWLLGRETGRPALVLSHAPAGRSPDGSLVTGTTIDADLAFYPGSAPLRALVAERYGLAAAGPPPGIGLTRLPGLIAEVLAADPWTDSWPVVLAGVVPAADGLLLDEEGVALLIQQERSEEHTSELQSRENIVCRLLLENKKAGLSDQCRSGWIHT